MDRPVCWSNVVMSTSYLNGKLSQLITTYNLKLNLPIVVSPCGKEMMITVCGQQENIMRLLQKIHDEDKTTKVREKVNAEHETYTRPVMKDDITNIVISLNTTKTVDEFIKDIQ